MVMAAKSNDTIERYIFPVSMLLMVLGIVASYAGMSTPILVTLIALVPFLGISYQIWKTKSFVLETEEMSALGIVALVFVTSGSLVSSIFQSISMSVIYSAGVQPLFLGIGGALVLAIGISALKKFF